MPITQAQMIDQMRESRAAIQNVQELRHALTAYVQSAQVRYPANQQLQEVLIAIEATLRLHPEPVDKVTYRNEYHYRRVGKANDRQRLRQEIERRKAGKMTQEEAIERLQEYNQLRKTAGQTYEQFNSEEERKPTKGIIFPRDDPDDKELDFEGQPSDSLFAKPKEP